MGILVLGRTSAETGQRRVEQGKVRLSADWAGQGGAGKGPTLGWLGRTTIRLLPGRACRAEQQTYKYRAGLQGTYVQGSTGTRQSRPRGLRSIQATKG